MSRWWKCDIMKTCLYNFDPLKTHFNIIKLGFTGYTLFFLILLENIDCGYSLELPCQGSSNEYPQSVFWAEIWKISEFFIWKFSFFLDPDLWQLIWVYTVCSHGSVQTLRANMVHEQLPGKVRYFSYLNWQGLKEIMTRDI